MARGCEDDLSMSESRIKASANFFGPSCKPGPWVSDPLQDAILSEEKKNRFGCGQWSLFYFHFLYVIEQKYPLLCEMCYNPGSCSKSDKYWGRVGPLMCLTGGRGDVAWVRLDDVKGHFGVSVNVIFASSCNNLAILYSLAAWLQNLIQSCTVFCVWMGTCSR